MTDELEHAQDRAEASVVAALRDHVMVPRDLFLRMSAVYHEWQSGRLVDMDPSAKPPDTPPPKEPPPIRLMARSIPRDWTEAGAKRG